MGNGNGEWECDWGMGTGNRNEIFWLKKTFYSLKIVF